MAEGGYFLLFVEAIARVLTVLAFFALTKEFPRVFGGISEHTRIGVIVFVTHILFEKLGPILRGVRKVDTDYLDGYVGADDDDPTTPPTTTAAPTTAAPADPEVLDPEDPTR